MPAHPTPRHFPSGELPPGGAPATPPRTTGARRAHTLLDISHRLRARDYTIAALLDEHTTLSTEHLSAVLFDNPTTCRHRCQAEISPQISSAERLPSTADRGACSWVPALACPQNSTRRPAGSTTTISCTPWAA